MPPIAPLPESLRREYLQALGIDCYMPRVQLPGAPVSALASIASPDALSAGLAGESAVQTAAETAVEAQQPASNQSEHQENSRPSPADSHKPPAPATDTSVGRAQSAKEKAAVSATSGQQVSAIEQPREKTRKPGEEVKLQLLCIRVGEGKSGAAVIAAMPHIGPAQFSARHQGLLANLLRACGIAVGDMEMEEKPFRWPMVNGLHVDNSRRAAASALKAYLLQKHVDWHFGNLLVMGEGVVSPLFEPADDNQSDPVTGNLLEQGQWNLIYTRSLDELLQSPALKKDAWLEIRKRFTK